MGKYPFFLDTITISGVTLLTSAASREVTDFVLINRAANAGTIIVKSEFGNAGNGFVIDKGNSVVIAGRVDLADLTAEGTNGDLLGLGYHR